MKDKLTSVLRAAGVSEDAVATYCNAYDHLPWASDAHRDEWAQKLAVFVEGFSASKPPAEVAQILNLQARRIATAYAGNVAAHAKAVDDLTTFLKAHTEK